MAFDPHVSTMPTCAGWLAQAEILDSISCIQRLLSMPEVPPYRPDIWLLSDAQVLPLIKKLHDTCTKFVAKCRKDNPTDAAYLSDDEIIVIHAFTLENPYPLYRLLNGWMSVPGREMNATVLRHVAPFARLLLTALCKLPLVTTKASRAVEVNGILKPVFDAGGLPVDASANFWSFPSFSTSDAVLAKFRGQNGIVYTCPSMQCVSIKAFSDKPDEEEAMPIPPAIFKVYSSYTHSVGTFTHVLMTLSQESNPALDYLDPKLL